MEAFVVVVRSGSLAGAARVMNLSVPALSRRIRHLEAELGCRLFQRQPTGLAMTEAGRSYFAALAPAWDGIAAATEAARRGGRENVIRLSVMPSLAAAWLVPRLDGFRARHPRLAVEVSTSPELEDLGARSDLDCALRLGRAPWPGLDGVPLFPAMAGPVASPQLLAVNAPIDSAADLLQRRLLGTRHQPAFWREWFAAMGLDAVPACPDGFDNLLLVYEAAAAGMGIALGIDPVVRPFLESGRLRPVFPAPVRLPRDFHLVWRTGTAAAGGKLKMLHDWLLDEVAAAALHPAEA